MEKFTESRVLWVKRHTPKLITFAVERPESYRFVAGQFARLGFRKGDDFVRRAYSILSPEYENRLEFMAVLIPEGEMSARLRELKTGDTVLLDKEATGFLLPQRFVGGEDLLLLATGSGIAPFLAQIRQPETWQRFPRIVLTHCVRRTEELIFDRMITDLPRHPLVGEAAKSLIYIPVTTRENDPERLHFRLPESLRNHSLERAAGFAFTPERTRIMICGNPAMIDDTYRALRELGFSGHRNKMPGQIIMENGF